MREGVYKVKCREITRELRGRRRGAATERAPGAQRVYLLMRRRSVEFKAAERRATVGRQDVANGERTADDAEAARVHMLKVLIAVSKFRRVLKSRHAETSFRKIKAADSFRKGSLACRLLRVRELCARTRPPPRWRHLLRLSSTHDSPALLNRCPTTKPVDP